MPAADADLVPLDELIRRTPGAHPIGSIDDLRCDAFDTEEEVREFLAFVVESRHGAPGNRRLRNLRCHHVRPSGRASQSPPRATTVTRLILMRGAASRSSWSE